MSINIDVVWDPDPEQALDLPETAVHDAVQKALHHRSVTSGTVTVVIAGHSLVHRLNKEYLGHDYRTDVLSFVLSDPEEMLEGEIYVDAEMALERAHEFSATPERELLRYVVHGILHLTGMDDSDEQGKSAMTIAEDAILSYIAM
ncbi:MAG: rRNA maturation RNase YbeY [Rhodothermales bacterium]|nr:rRNA maturation RNase YbeY [Rhodothermales bacterium]